MKNIFLLVLVALATIAPTMAVDPITTTVNWAGVFGTTSVNTNFGGDATSLVTFSGNNLVGNLWTTDYKDNPYGYGVDTIQNKISANFGTGVEGYGGTLTNLVTKTDNYVPMYGGPGATSSTTVQSSGTGYMGMNTVANYAEFSDANFGASPVPSNWQLSATGNTYGLQHAFTDAIQTSNGASFQDGAMVQIVGSGTGKITDMNDNSIGGQFNFGSGNGCYDNAHAQATGSGQFTLTASQHNSLWVGGVLDYTPGNFKDGAWFKATGDGTPNSASLTFTGNWLNGGFSADNWQIFGGA